MENIRDTITKNYKDIFNHLIAVLSGIFILFTISTIIHMNSSKLLNLMQSNIMFTFFIEIVSTLILIVLVTMYFLMGYRGPLQWFPYGKLAGDNFLVGITVGTIISFIVGQFDPLPGLVLPLIEGIYFVLACMFLLYFTAVYFISLCRKNDERTEDENVKGNLFDSPIKTFSEDRLGRKDFVVRVSHFIEEHESDGYSIGIIGEWGSGKTSIINLIKKTIPENFVKIDFNPWYFGENNHDIIKAFFSKLANALEDKPIKKTLKKQLKMYGDILSSISIRSNSLTFTFKELLEKISPKDSTSLDDLKAGIEKSLSEFEHPICIFIDDLDRLSPEEVQMIFKLVRLIADFKGVIYILCMDESVILDSLQGMYKNSMDQNDVNLARRYMEKFIQVPIYLPRVDNSKFGKVAWKEIVGILSNMSIIVTDLYEPEFIDRVNHLNFNLRTLKRFLTTVELYMGLLKNEVDVKDLIYLLMIKSKDSKLHDYIYTHSNFFLSRNDIQNDQEFRKIFPNYLTYKDILGDILPLSSGLWDKNFQSHSIKLNEDLKLTNPKFFNRYFQYSLPEKEAQFKNIELFLNLFTEINDENEILKIYCEFINDYEADYVLNRICAYVNNIDNDAILDRVLTMIRMRLYDAYLINSGVSDQEVSALENLANEVFKYVPPTKILIFIDTENLVYGVKNYEYLVSLMNESDKWVFENLIKDMLNRRAETELSLFYTLADCSIIFKLWCELEGENNVIKQRIEGWLVDEHVLNKVLEYTLPIKKDERELLNDYEKHISLYLKCIALVDILPMNKVRELLIKEKDLPISLKEINNQFDEDFHLKVFSFVHANFYKFGYENILEINSFGGADSKYFVYYQLLFNYDYNEDNLINKKEFNNRYRELKGK